MAFKPYITWVNDNQSTFSRFWDDVNEDPDSAPPYATLVMRRVWFTDWCIIDIKEFMDVWEDMTDTSEQAAYAAYCDDTPGPMTKKEFDRDYLGTWSSFTEYARELVEEVEEIPGCVEPYINWDDLARDLANDYNVLSVREGVAIFLR